MTRPGAVLLSLAAGALLLAYSLAAHWLTISDNRSAIGYGFALASIWLVIVLAAWASRYRWLAALLAGVMVGLAWWLHLSMAWDPRWIYLIEHAGTNFWLGVLFGSSLLGSRPAIVTRLALMVHGTLPPKMVIYTRQVTLAWTVYFAVMTGASLLLFFGGWAWWWSVLVNFVTGPAVALMFVIEYMVRWRLHPDFEHASLLESFRSFGRKS